MSDTSLTPTVGALVLTGVAPVISRGIVPTTGALTTTGIAGAIGIAESGAVTLRRLTATGNVVALELDGPGQGVLRKLTAVGYEPDTGAVVFEALTAAGRDEQADYGRATLRALEALNDAGYVSLKKLIAYGIDSEAVSTVYTTKVMNTRNTAVTEYTNFAFNSFAKIGDSYYGAGPAGFVRLDGDTDSGTAIPWRFRTGQLDGKEPDLKRLPEVIVGLRTSGPVRVRLWQDDNTYFDQMLPPVKLNTIHQHRVKGGKGMRSRYFMVEMQGVSGSDIELDSMQIEFAKTTRKFG